VGRFTGSFPQETEEKVSDFQVKIEFNCQNQDKKNQEESSLRHKRIKQKKTG